MIMTPISIQNSLQDRHLGTENRYAIEDVLDRGGIGTIYLATDTHLSRKVVIKLLKAPLPSSAAVHQRFKQEVELHIGVDSKYVAKILDSGTNPVGCPFYVMEYLQGKSLKQLLTQEKLLPIDQAINIARQICLAMEAFYKVRIESGQQFGSISQDLKPTHIFLLPAALGEQVYVLDSSLAKKIHNLCNDNHHTNLKSLLEGTCQYIAPEQLEPREEVDRRADIYILGIILFEMFSGTNPFSIDINSPLISDVSWIQAHIEKKPRPLQPLLGSCQTSIELSNIVSKCLQKRPSDRYASMQALREALELVEVSDRMLPDQTQSVRKSQSTTEFSTPLNPLPSEHSEDLTFAQSVSFLSEVKEAQYSNDETVVQILPETGLPTSHPSVALAQHLYPSNKNLRIADSVKPLYRPDYAVEPEHSVRQPSEQFSLSSACRDLGGAAATALDKNCGAENTIVQYSDSAIHNPAEHTIVQVIAPLPDEQIDQTVHQGFLSPLNQSQKRSIVQNSIPSQIPQQSISQNCLSRTGSYASRFINIPGRFFHAFWTRIDFNWLKSRLRPTQRLSPAKTPARQPSVSSNHQSTHWPVSEIMVTETQPYSEQHRKTVHELDHCRLSFAKELARNGKFRDAITMAEQVSAASRFFKDAQTLIRSWKKL